MPGSVIDRDSMRGWKASGSMDAFDRAKECVTVLIASYQRPELDPDKEKELHAFVLDLSHKCGIDVLPEHEASRVTV